MTEKRHKRDRQPAGPTAIEAHPETAKAAAALTRRQHLLLLAVFVVALAFRGGYLWSQAQANPVFHYPQMDGLVHHQWAEHIAEGAGMEARPYIRAPLYYYLLALVYKVFGASAVAGRILGIVLGSLTCYLLARLGIMLSDFRVGLLAGAIAAVYWPFVYFDGELLSVALEVLLNVVLLIALLRAARRGRLAAHGVAGIAWGVAALARPNVLAAAPVLWLWWWMTSRREQGVLRRLRVPVVATGGAVLCILPVTLRNYFVGGEAVLIASSGGINFFIGNHAESTGYLVEVPGARTTWDEWLIDVKDIPQRALGRTLTDGEVSDYWFGQATEWISREPSVWISHLAHKFRLFWSPVEVPNNQPILFLAQLSPWSNLFWVGFPAVACLAAGGAVALRRDAWRSWSLPVAFAGVYMATVVAFFCPARFRLPVVPVLILLAAAGVVGVADLLRRRRWQRAMPLLVATALAAVFVATNPPERTSFRRQALVEGHYLLGKYCAQAPPKGPGDLPRAASELRRAVELAPEPHRRAALAHVLRQAKDTSAAADQFRLAAEENPNLLDAQTAWARFLVEQDDPATARGVYLRAVQLAPGDRVLAEELSDVEYNLGTQLLASGKTEHARIMLEAVVTRASEHALAWQNLGAAYARLGRMEDCVNAFTQTLRIDPTQREASINLARAHRLIGDRREAIRVLNEALAYASEDPRVLTRLAYLLATAPDAEDRDGPRAVILAEQAVARSGDRPGLDVVEALAAAYAETGRFAEARGLAEQGLAAAESARSTEWVQRFRDALGTYSKGQPQRD